MAIFRALGNALVDHDELRAKSLHDDLNKTIVKKQFRLEFSNGVVTNENLVRSFLPQLGGKPVTFEPIGIGKPLVVQIRHVYTGNKAHGFWGDKDMLVASTMKSVAVYDGAPRAVNYLVKKTPNNQNFRAIPATDKGTPIIFYTPALVQYSSVVTVEVMFDNFPQETFDAVSQAFSSAAGIPVFAPASAYLTVAGMITKLIGSVGESLCKGTPALRQTEEITFLNPGSIIAESGFWLLISDNVQEQVLSDHKINELGMLVHISTNQEYKGPEPYVVISLDGRTNDELKDFTPTAASAALLDKFYNINEGGSQSLNLLTDGLKLYNDIKFREKADAAAAKLNKMEPGTDNYITQQSLFNAYVSNITSDLLKPRQ